MLARYTSRSSTRRISCSPNRRRKLQPPLSSIIQHGSSSSSIDPTVVTTLLGNRTLFTTRIQPRRSLSSSLSSSCRNKSESVIAMMSIFDNSIIFNAHNPTTNASSSSQSCYRSFASSPSSVVAAAETADEDLEDDDDETIQEIDVVEGKVVSGGKSIEEQYIKKTPREHVLLRPGMYVGPVGRSSSTSSPSWVLEPIPSPYNFQQQKQQQQEKGKQQQQLPLSSSTTTTQQVTKKYRMVQKENSTYIPALIKIFDEILVNASDNRLRDPYGCTKLDVRIDPGSSDTDNNNRDPMIRIWNNGKGIPVQIHKEENMYLPEMLFGHLLTGSNFDDNEKRLTGGRHGYGAKLTNIFSKSFTVETYDSSNGLLYKQTWYDNMTKTTQPEIIRINNNTDLSSSSEEDYTSITFVPDMPRLAADDNAKMFDIQDYAHMCRRVIDVAGCCSPCPTANGRNKKSSSSQLQVYLNGQNVSMSSYVEYTNMYRRQHDDEASSHVISDGMCFSTVNPRWMVGVGLSEGHSFDSISFVNGMSTPRGGTHVNVIVNQVVKKIQETVSKMEPDLADTLSPALIRRNLFISCNALVENPIFDSQMKEYLTSSPTTFGSSYTLDGKYLNEIVTPETEGGPGIVEEVIRMAKGRQQANLFKLVGAGGKQSKRQLLGVAKLEDAHSAGTARSEECTLILTEGDSAKALAVAGLEVIGRDTNGVFPLRGKFLNVRHASVDKLAKNAEVKSLIAILGLDFDKEYDTSQDRKELRYGHVMLMTDQDTDGSHIKGLVINFFRHFWPKLLKPPVDHPATDGDEQQFLSSFVTPLLKATKKNSKETISFYSMAEYDEWRSAFQDDGDAKLKQWKIKYYKGLGTSTSAEAKEYFAAFDKHYRPFKWTSEQDGELIDKVFDKTRAADRREWISTKYDPTVTIDENEVTYEDFVNKEMIHFSNADNIRSLPNVIDGLKPSQRKVLYACFKRKLKSEIKVAQLSGYCAEHTAYHHGEASLQSTIIGMAQDYVGSNNINLLIPSGQFGTRLAGGEDAASPRYIFTYLSPIARYLFPEEDDELLEYLEDDGQTIEPKFYCPIIPLLLVNGSQGIGTGWSTYIPPHNPLSVVDYIRSKIDGQSDLPEIETYIRGFGGTIEQNSAGTGYTSFGEAKQISKRKILIDELPVGVWTNAYKDRLLKMQSKGLIQSFVENHTTSEVSFTIDLKPSQLARMNQKGLKKAFRLSSNLLQTNMNAFDMNGKIRKFTTPEDIADAFFPVRLALYEDRKSILQAKMEYNAKMMKNKARFIQMVAAGEIDLVGGRVSREDTLDLLRAHGFTTVRELDTIRNQPALELGNLDEDYSLEDEAADMSYNNGSDFDYLLRMPLASLTAEKIDELTRDAAKTESDLQEVVHSKPEDLWIRDLEKLSEYL